MTKIGKFYSGKNPFIFVKINMIYLKASMPQKKPPAFKNSVLQIINFFTFIFFCGSFCPGPGSGSSRSKSIWIHADPDPQHCE
jgi:hypothetical protein